MNYNNNADWWGYLNYEAEIQRRLAGNWNHQIKEQRSLARNRNHQTEQRSLTGNWNHYAEEECSLDESWDYEIQKQRPFTTETFEEQRARTGRLEQEEASVENCCKLKCWKCSEEEDYWENEKENCCTVTCWKKCGECVLLCFYCLLCSWMEFLKQ